MSNTRYAIVVAAGSGVRMGSNIPKQFLEMKGRPIIMRTLEAFHKCSPQIQLILVIPESYTALWQTLVKQYQFTVPVILQTGGPTRFQSVKLGLSKIQGPGLVAIHDGVRPVISSKIIEQSYRIAQEHGSAIASVDPMDSIRKVSAGTSVACDRRNFKLVQTPQSFHVDTLKKAYKLPEEAHYTDDASVWEAAGNKVTLFEGSHENIKITTFHDLVLAEVLWKFI